MTKHIEVAVELAKPINEVFDYYLIPENHKAWQEDLVDVERLDGPDIATGSRFKLRRRLGGRVHEGVWEITNLNRPHDVSLTARTQKGMLDHRSRAIFEATEAGTRLRLQVEPTPRGWVRLLTPLIRRAIQKELPKDLNKLKTVLEENP